MKNLVWTSIALLATGWARASCPDLAGSYSCPTLGSLEIAESSIPGGKKYIVEFGSGQQVLFADGIERYSYPFANTTTCSGNEMITLIRLALPGGGIVPAATETFIKQGSNVHFHLLQHTVNGDIVSQDETCTTN